MIKELSQPRLRKSGQPPDFTRQGTAAQPLPARRPLPGTGLLLSRSSAQALAYWSLPLNCLSIFHICFLSGNSFPCADSASAPSAWPALAKGPAPLRAPDLLQTPPSLRPLTSSSCLPASAGHRAEGPPSAALSASSGLNQPGASQVSPSTTVQLHIAQWTDRPGASSARAPSQIFPVSP